MTTLEFPGRVRKRGECQVCVEVLGHLLQSVCEHLDLSWNSVCPHIVPLPRMCTCTCMYNVHTGTYMYVYTSVNMLLINTGT